MAEQLSKNEVFTTYFISQRYLTVYKTVYVYIRDMCIYVGAKQETTGERLFKHDINCSCYHFAKMYEVKTVLKLHDVVYIKQSRSNNT